MVAEVLKLKESSDDKIKALEVAIGQIEKTFGKGSVMKLGQSESVVDIVQFLLAHWGWILRWA